MRKETVSIGWGFFSPEFKEEVKVEVSNMIDRLASQADYLFQEKLAGILWNTFEIQNDLATIEDRKIGEAEPTLHTHREATASVEVIVR